MAQAVDSGSPFHPLRDLGVNANGTLETKQDALAMRRTGTVRISGIEPSDIKVRVYNKRAGDWKIVSFEANRLK